MAWLILSSREPPELASQVRLRRVVEGAHAFRRARSKRELEFADTAFFVELCAFAMLGDAVFGERMRRLEGLAGGPGASREFRRRLGALLEAQLDAPPVPSKRRSERPRKKSRSD